MNIVACWRRAERRVRCACGVEVVAYRLAGGVWVAACLGCGRTLGEIAEWGLAPVERQRAILRDAAARLVDRR